MRSKMMTRQEIETELGWSREMISILLKTPDSPHARRDKSTGTYSYGLYRRKRVMAVAPTPEALMAKKRWDETVHGYHPATGWTTRLGDIGQQLGITGRAVGRILDLMSFRSGRQLTDHAVAAAFGVRRWNGDRFYTDWHIDRVVDAIRRAAACPNEPAVADALAAAVAKQQTKKQLIARRQRQKEVEAAQRRERQAVMAALQAELAVLMSSASDLPLLEAVEFVTLDPGDRLALYRSFENSVHDTEDDSLPRRSPTSASHLALLERRAEAEGVQI